MFFSYTAETAELQCRVARSESSGRCLSFGTHLYDLKVRFISAKRHLSFAGNAETHMQDNPSHS